VWRTIGRLLTLQAKIGLFFIKFDMHGHSSLFRPTDSGELKEVLQHRHLGTKRLVSFCIFSGLQKGFLYEWAYSIKLFAAVIHSAP
jgi:hypothetical protein